MRLDIRMPLGLLFSIVGLLLTAFGEFSSKNIYARSLGINVNFWWGVVLLLFGICTFLLGRRGHRSQSALSQSLAAQPADKSATGKE
jgi:hypothetical protein